MEKNIQKYWVNIGLTISFFLAAVTGVLKMPILFRQFKFVLPYNEMSFIHDWSGIVMTLLVLVHLVQNWKWMVCMTKKAWNFNRKKECE